MKTLYLKLAEALEGQVLDKAGFLFLQFHSFTLAKLLSVLKLKSVIMFINHNTRIHISLLAPNHKILIVAQHHKGNL